jgi:hypothetical protein
MECLYSQCYGLLEAIIDSIPWLYVRVLLETCISLKEMALNLTSFIGRKDTKQQGIYPISKLARIFESHQPLLQWKHRIAANRSSAHSYRRWV